MRLKYEPFPEPLHISGGGGTCQTENLCAFEPVNLEPALGFGVWGLGSGVWGLGFMVWD